MVIERSRTVISENLGTVIFELDLENDLRTVRIGAFGNS